MSVSTVLFDTRFGEVILKRRAFLSKDTSASKLSLYTFLLNDYPCFSRKKSLSRLAGGRMSFSYYDYGDGYVLEGSLSQAQNKALSYVFSNPYQEGENLLNEVFFRGFECDKSQFELSQDRLYTLLKKEETSSLSSGLSSLHVLYQRPLVKKEEVKKLTLEEMKEFISVIAKADSGDSLYLGKKKDKAYGSTPFYQKDLVLGEYQGEDMNPDTSLLQDESVFVILTHEDIKSTGLSELYASYALIREKIDRMLANKVSVSYQVNLYPLSQRKSCLALTCNKGKLDSILLQFSIKENESLGLDSLPISPALREEEMRKLSLKMDSSFFVKDILERKDFQAEETEFNEDRLKNLLSSYKVEKVFPVQKGERA